MRSKGTPVVIALGVVAVGALVCAESSQRQPEEALVRAAIEALIKEGHSDAICVVLSDGHASANLEQSTYDAIRRAHPRFFECTGSATTFAIGPVYEVAAGSFELQVRRVAANSPCRYKVKQSRGKWRVTMLPCIAM